MSTRMDKYKDEFNESEKRTTRNRGIYSKIEDDDIEKLNLTNNIAVLDTDTSNLDINKLKEMLDSKYKEKKEPISSYEDAFEESADEELEDTKEYDLKKVIANAHHTQSRDYDRERFQKVRETEYEILSNLDIKKEEAEPENLSEEETTLINLIKTINENSLKKVEEKNDDLLGDLKGNEDTEVLEPINLEEDTKQESIKDETLDITVKKPTLLEELEKTKQLSKKEIIEKLEEPLTEEEIKEHEPLKDTAPVNTNTFYTGDLSITEHDLDDFKDLQKEVQSGNILIKILIGLLILIVLAIGIYFLNKYMDLGLF